MTPAISPVPTLTLGGMLVVRVRLQPLPGKMRLLDQKTGQSDGRWLSSQLGKNFELGSEGPGPRWELPAGLPSQEEGAAGGRESQRNH